MVRAVLTALLDGPLDADGLEHVTALPYADLMRTLKTAVLSEAVERSEGGAFVLTPTGREIISGADVKEVAVTTERLPNTRQQRIWSAMRTLGKFCRLDLEGIARQSDELRTNFAPAADAYMRVLERAGYLGRLDFPAVKGSGGGRARYRLARDTGVLAPVIKPGPIVWDRNTGARYAAKR